MTTVGQQTLGDRYELQELIATGGMGQVWRARDVVLERSVAVKVLRSEYADDPTFLARFRNEARHSAALSHPNIATVLDYGEDVDDGTGEHLAYLVMELVEGAPLSTRISAEGPLDTDTALSVLRQAAAGLAAAHDAGVVHRDVKPANILVRPDGRVKLTDFGIAWSAECVPLTQTGQVVGTAQYMSPEQAVGERVGPASDVYALGLVGYESLTGRAAFSGTNPVMLALKQVREQPEPLPTDLPPDVRELIGSALTKDPAARLRDGAAFLTAVEETLEHRPRAVPPPPPVTAASGAVAPRAATPHAGRAVGAAPVAGARRARHARPDGTRRRLLVLLPLLALALVLGGMTLVSTRTGDAPAAPTAGPDRTTQPDGTARPDPATGPGPAGIVLAADDHVGRPVTEVVEDLTALGLTVGRRSEATAGAPAGTVVRLDPVGEELTAGDQVQVVTAAAPEAAAPEVAAPGTAAPGTAAPDTVPPDTAVPAPGRAGTEAGAEVAPGTTAPGTTAPGTTAPGTTAPGTTAPGTTTPGTTAPGTTAPSTPAPGTTTPGTTAPGTSAPGSTAPQPTPPTAPVTPTPAAPTPGGTGAGTTPPTAGEPAGTTAPPSAGGSAAEESTPPGNSTPPGAPAPSSAPAPGTTGSAPTSAEAGRTGAGASG